MKTNIHRLALSAMLLALALLLPFLTGQIPQVGAMLCPMHIPVLLCGFFCGWPWGLAVGLTAPILRSALFFMPPMYPAALCMSLELAAYGAVSGALYTKTRRIYPALLGAMVLGRLVWGAAQFACVGLDSSKFGLAAFWAGAFTTAIPGIAAQLILIPVLVRSLQKAQEV